MFMRKQRVELDILDHNRTPGKEEDEYIDESLEKKKTVVLLVERQVKRNLD